MKKEVCLKFRLPKDEYQFSIYENAEEFHEALVSIHKYLNSGNLDITLEDMQGYFRDVTHGLPL